MPTGVWKTPMKLKGCDSTKVACDRYIIAFMLINVKFVSA
jgi:hypothetical protein